MPSSRLQCKAEFCNSQQHPWIPYPRVCKVLQHPSEVAKIHIWDHFEWQVLVLELTEYLVELGFKAGWCVPCLFVKITPKTKYTSSIALIACFITAPGGNKKKEFEELLQWRFDLELMGQAHVVIRSE